MKTVDKDGNVLKSVDYEKGYTNAGKLLVKHHDAVEYKEARYENVKVYENDKGDELYEWRMIEPAVNAQDAWDEYEDVIVYTPYTEEELAKRAEEKAKNEQLQKEAEEKAKAQAEKDKQREEFLTAAPNRLDSLEQSQLDTDEAITSLYEALTTSTEA